MTPAAEPQSTVDPRAYEKINFGCGYDKREGYLNLDMDPACHPDILLTTTDLTFLPKGHFSEIYAKDVLEHIPRTQTLNILLEFASLLRTGGDLMVQTTSIPDLARRLSESASFADEYGWTICLFGTQAHPGDFHYTGFTERTMAVHLAAAGFEIIDRELIDGWMMRFSCRKIASWEDLLNDNVQDDLFLQRAYQYFFSRDLDETGTIHFGGQLKGNRPRREVLKEIGTSPERLFVTARRLAL
ncbi:MAG: DUF4214 domain-containing protein [Caulobacteraceae bacterium]